jgi:hypothetical protein
METPERFFSRPVRVVAIQWMGDNLRAVQEFCLPASPFYAPAVITRDPVTTRSARLQVQVRDEVADEKFPALAPQFKTVDVPLGAWLVQRVDDDYREVIVLTHRRFEATFQAMPQVPMFVERLPAGDDQGSTIDR